MKNNIPSEKIENNGLWKVVISFLLLIACLLLPLAAANRGFDYLNYVYNLIYMTAWIFLPGKILTDFFSCKLKFSLGLRILTAFYLGFAFLIGQYYLLTLLNLRILLVILSPSFAIIALLLRRYQKRNFISGIPSHPIPSHPIPSHPIPSHPIHNISCLLKNKILAILYIFSCIVSSGVQFLKISSPAMTGGASINADVLWHIGNINTLSGSSSFIDYRVHTVTFVYHYFSDLLYAIEKIIIETLRLPHSNLIGFNFIVQDQFLVTGFLMGLSTYLLFKEIFQQENKAIIALFLTLFLFFAFNPDNSGIGGFWLQWTTNFNSVGLALPCSILIALVMLKWIKSSRKQVILFGILLLVLLAMLSGLKGPFGLVIASGIAVWVVYETVVKILNKRLYPLSRFWSTNIVILVSSLAGFLLIYLTLLNKGGSTAAVFSLENIRIYGKTGFVANLLAITGNHVYIRILLAVATFIIMSNGIGLVWIVSVWSFFRKSKESWKESAYSSTIFLLLIPMVSLAFYFTIWQQYGSQSYFYYTSIPFIAVIAWQFIFGLKVKYNKKAKTIASVVSALAGVSIFLYQNIFGLNIIQIFTEPIKYSTDSLVYPHGKQPYDISAAEYQGLEWVSKNIPKNALLATNRHAIGPLTSIRFYYYTALTDRMFYAEGTQYAENSGLSLSQGQTLITQNDKLFSAGYSKKYELAKALKVKYLINSVYGINNSLPDTSGFTCLYKNKDISVWKVN